MNTTTLSDFYDTMGLGGAVSMRTSWLGFGVTCTVSAALVFACGGATDTDVLGAVPSQGTSSGATTSGSTGGLTSSGSSGASSSGVGGSSSSGVGGSSSSGVPCMQECAQPPPGCSIAPGCTCQIVCPDAGPPDSGGPLCTWSPNAANTCPDGFYCNATNCQIGTCVKKATTESTTRSPACGCDGNTYWNESVASLTGMPLRYGGACTDLDQAKCGGLSGKTCTNAASCNHNVRNKGSCLTETTGTCWRLPSTCGAVAGGRARACTTATCSGECDAIRSGVTWFDDGSCP